jgi:uncharacterized membrane protein YdjX (TVP38/TMEM64 family)
VGRSTIEKRAALSPRFAVIDRAVADQGFKMVLLTRLSPIFPFTLLNYLFSVSRVRPKDYFLGSLIGMFPGTVMYVYFGSLIGNVRNLADGNVEQTPAQQMTFFVGLGITVVVTLYITRVARRAMAQYVSEEDASSPAPSSSEDS